MSAEDGYPEFKTNVRRIQTRFGFFWHAMLVNGDKWGWGYGVTEQEALVDAARDYRNRFVV